GQRSFELRLARAALSTFEVDLPERGLRVDVQPSLGVSVSGDAADGKTHVTAYLASGDAPVTVTWYPKPKDVEGNDKPLVFAERGTVRGLDEGTAKATVRATYSVEQAPAEQFRLLVPAGWKVLDVSGAGIREQEVTESKDGQILRIALHERTKSFKV